MARRSQVIWTFAITSIALFMVTLDNLVVTTALPVIRHDLNANLQQLEWTINAYTLTFAVLLLAGAALGDRFGRRRVFSIGLAVFTVGSAASALAQNPTIDSTAPAVDRARRPRSHRTRPRRRRKHATMSETLETSHPSSGNSEITLELELVHHFGKDATLALYCLRDSIKLERYRHGNGGRSTKRH